MNADLKHKNLTDAILCCFYKINPRPSAFIRVLIGFGFIPVSCICHPER